MRCNELLILVKIRIRFRFRWMYEGMNVLFEFQRESDALQSEKQQPEIDLLHF